MGEMVPQIYVDWKRICGLFFRGLTYPEFLYGRTAPSLRFPELTSCL